MSPDGCAFLLCGTILLASAAWSLATGKALYSTEDAIDGDLPPWALAALNLSLALASFYAAWAEH